MDGDVDGRMDWLVDGCLDELMETGREGGRVLQLEVDTRKTCIEGLIEG